MDNVSLFIIVFAGS